MRLHPIPFRNSEPSRSNCTKQTSKISKKIKKVIFKHARERRVEQFDAIPDYRAQHRENCKVDSFKKDKKKRQLLASVDFTWVEERGVETVIEKRPLNS